MSSNWIEVAVWFFAGLALLFAWVGGWQYRAFKRDRAAWRVERRRVLAQRDKWASRAQAALKEMTAERDQLLTERTRALDRYRVIGSIGECIQAACSEIRDELADLSKLCPASANDALPACPAVVPEPTDEKE